MPRSLLLRWPSQCPPCYPHPLVSGAPSPPINSNIPGFSSTNLDPTDFNTPSSHHSLSPTSIEDVQVCHSPQHATDVEGPSPQINLVVALPPLPPISPINIEDQPLEILSMIGGSGTLTSSSENGGNCSSTLEVDGERSLWANKTLSKAEKIWMMAKDIGVLGSENDGVYIDKISELEQRDNERSVSKETITGAR